MTYEQYWYDDPLMVRAFYKADKLRQSKTDYQAWLTGVYIKTAIEATVGNVVREKGTQPISYPDKPYSFKEEEKRKEKTAEKEAQEEAFARLYMYNMVRAGKEWGKH